MTTYFNVKDFADIQLSKNFAEDRNCQVCNASVHGKQSNYDVFIPVNNIMKFRNTRFVIMIF